LNSLTPGSNKKIWWKCPKGKDHIWEAPLKARNRGSGSGCAICLGRKVVPSNSLRTTHPELVDQWHPTLNGEITPENVHQGMGKKVWWKCPEGEDHEWDATIKNRAQNGSGCSICSGDKVVPSVCLSRTHPHLVDQWDFEKNGELTPKMVRAGSSKNVYWNCPKGFSDHNWKASIKERAKRGTGCPYCSGLKVAPSTCFAAIYPEIAKEWHPTKNGNLTPYQVAPKSGKKVWWKCPLGSDHEWKAIISSRAGGSGCGVCSGLVVVKSNCLATTHSEIAEQWHPTKNGKLTPEKVTAGSNKNVWWKCPKGDDHIWDVPVVERKKYGCPVCDGKKVVWSTSLAYTHPQIASQWHPTLNGNKKPEDNKAGSNTEIYWKCPEAEDHVWKTKIYSRLHGKECPCCSGYKVVPSNCLSTTHPELVKEWDFEKNTLIPDQVYHGSHQKFFWICSHNQEHKWKAQLKSRSVAGRGCPECILIHQSKEELTLSFELQLFFDIDPLGRKIRVGNKLLAVDIFIEELNLCIEYDGSFWHKEKAEKDKLKTMALEKKGFDVLRVRQKPLERLFPTDILVKKPFNGKYTVDKIISFILDNYQLDEEIETFMNRYLASTQLKNKTALDEYIDKKLKDRILAIKELIQATEE
jgi:hypothetical protein